MAVMWKYSLLLVFQIFCLIASKAAPPKDSPNTQPASCSDQALQTLLKGNAALTGKFMHEAYKSKPDENLIMSPFSLFVPLGELGLYAEGNTYTQLIQALNLQSKDEIRCTFPRLASRLREEQNVVLSIAARIFASNRHPLTRAFLDDTKNVFDAEAESIDFLKRKEAADRINQWVESQTNERIKDIAKEDMFDKDTRLVLANAIYFLGNWESQFDSYSTEERDFHFNESTKVLIPTMYQQNYFRYGEVKSLNCKVLEMNYKGGNFSFVIFLPNEVDGLPQLIEKLQDPETFYSAYDSADHVKVNVHLPKIKIESEYDLAKLLSKIGITDIFDKDASNLQNILEEPVPLYVSTARQKAFVEIDEKGTEATAANIFVVAEATSFGGPRPIVHNFIADHPFAFYILNKRDVLFGGTFVRK